MGKAVELSHHGHRSAQAVSGRRGKGERGAVGADGVQDAGVLAGLSEIGVPLAASLGPVHPQVVIDFSVPVAAAMVAAICDG